MALIKCPECNGTVSTKAPACPHCGWVVIEPKSVEPQQFNASENVWVDQVRRSKITNQPHNRSEDLVSDAGAIKNSAETSPTEKKQSTEKPHTIGEIISWMLIVLVMVLLSILFPKECHLDYLPGPRGGGYHPIPLHPPGSNR